MIGVKCQIHLQKKGYYGTDEARSSDSEEWVDVV